MIVTGSSGLYEKLNQAASCAS